MFTNLDSDAGDSEPQDPTDPGENYADADIGSPGSLDVINEDTNRDENTRAAGFMGKSSAVTWVPRAKLAATQDFKIVNSSMRLAATGTFTESTYHAEPGDFLAVGTQDVNPREWPPHNVAKALTDAYFEHVHIAFPVMSKHNFYTKFRSFPKNQPSSEDHCWLALINLVFAIGAKYAHLVQSDIRGDDRDHLVYYARARALGIDERTLNQDPELMHTTCLGVLGLYLLATDQLNR